MGLMEFMKKYVGSLVITLIGSFLALFGIVMAVTGSNVFKTELLKTYSFPVGFIIAILGLGIVMYARYYFRQERQGM